MRGGESLAGTSERIWALPAVRADEWPGGAEWMVASTGASRVAAAGKSGRRTLVAGRGARRPNGR